MRLSSGVAPPKSTNLTPVGKARRIGIALEKFAGLVEQYQPRPDELLTGTAAAESWTRFLGGIARLELRHDELTVAVQGVPDRKRTVPDRFKRSEDGRHK